MLRELYAPFLRTERPFLVMSPESAEMTKYVANAMLATKISFINEMANLCERVGADINDVRRGIGHDQRHRLPVPLPRRRLRRQLLPQGRPRAHRTWPSSTASPLRLMEAVDAVNEAQKQVLVRKIRDALRRRR